MTLTERRRFLAVCLLLGLGAIGLYAPVLTFDFVSYDDPIYVLNNPRVNHGLATAFAWAFQTGYRHAWQPLTWLSHALDCQIFGLRPGGHHATSLLLHALNSVLVFVVLRRLTGAFWRSAAVAAFFAWHPLHVETAAWVSERKGVLCAFFWLLTVWAYTRYAQNLKARVPNQKLFYAGALVMFAMALMSAPLAATLPLVLLLLDWWPLQRFEATAERPLRKQILLLLAEKIPFFTLAMAACVINVMTISRSATGDPIAALPLRIRFVAAGLSCFRYLWETFWPVDLGAPYPFAIHTPKLELLAVAFLLLAISAVAVFTRKSRPYVLAGWLWFLVVLFPVLNLVQTESQPYADRYMYLPSIGLWMALCWVAGDALALSRFGRPILGGLCGALLAGCCALSWVQIGAWKDEGTLLARIPESDSNAFGHAEYAEALLRHEQLTLARSECEKAVSIAPDNSRFQVLLGDTLLAERKPADAFKKFQAALALDPTLELARLGLGRCKLVENHPAEAIAEANTVLQHQPGNFEAHNFLAQIHKFEGKPADAAAEYRASLALRADQPETLNDLAWLLATSPRQDIRHGAEAVQLAQRACGLTHGKQPLLLGTLAAAFAETGDFDKAVEAAEKAHNLALVLGQKAVSEYNLQMLDLFRDHKPFREKPVPPPQ